MEGMEVWSRISEKERRIPNGDSAANVGDLVEMESQIHLILKVTGEMETYLQRDIGDLRTHGVGGQHSVASDVTLATRHGEVVLVTCLLQRKLRPSLGGAPSLAYRSIASSIGYPHQSLVKTLRSVIRRQEQSSGRAKASTVDRLSFYSKHNRVLASELGRETTVSDNPQGTSGDRRKLMQLGHSN
ncbi:hypothetical protein Acr_10g0004810 [Actinidia rufa]|uniref:Uncharacterized protein n=1 Tax=Actinidia rufa TaxID=165716 RepID=A0A7J0F9I7_9ERIC|nr:hypothetical protein Acr_10g0004810 [Actinidia rufa]